MFSPSPMEVLIVLAVVLLLFGKRLPGVMHSVGKSIVEFKKGVKGVEDESDEGRDAERRDTTSTGKA